MILVIASIEVHIVRVDDERHADQHEQFDAVRTAIDDVPVEYVRVLVRWQPVLNRDFVEREATSCDYFMEDEQQIGEITV